MRPKPRIVQCLCGPARHCITALAYEPHTGDMTEENAAGRLEQFVDKAIAERLINPWCAICRAKRERWYSKTASSSSTRWKRRGLFCDRPKRNSRG